MVKRHGISGRTVTVESNGSSSFQSYYIEGTFSALYAVGEESKVVP